MTCPHNQAEIDRLQGQIDEKRQQQADLRANIKKCEEIREKHNEFNKKIQCVIDKLAEGENHVKAGESYDNGKMAECLDASNATIADCNKIITESRNKINSLSTEIHNLQRQIDSLQGICDICAAELEKNK